MREAFHEQLDVISAQVVAMLRRVGGLMERAGTALLDGNVARADQVIAEYAGLGVQRGEVESFALKIMVQQAPVASDLRTVLSVFHIDTELERMGALSLHIARIAAGQPAFGDLDDVLANLKRAVELTAQITALTAEMLQTQKLELLPEIERVEAAMDAVRSALFTAALAPDWSRGVEACVRLTEAARYFERYADHAVKIAQQVVFVVTGVAD